MANWKASGLDKVHAYWLKRFNTLHNRIARQFNGIIATSKVPEWMTKGKTYLIQKDKSKGAVVSNFRPITCLPLMWKLLTGILSNSIYTHLDEKGLLPVEQKGCRRNSRGTKDQLLIDRTIMRNCKTRQTNMSMCWIDYKKAFDMVPHSWILTCLEKFKIADNIKRLIRSSMTDWRTELTAGKESLGQVKIDRGIFQGDSLSPLLFVLALIPMSIVLNKTNLGYKLGPDRSNVNHLLFMDDLKLYGKDTCELDSLVQSVRIFSEDIGMEFGINKCAVLEITHGKVQRREGIELPNGAEIRSLDPEEHYKYLGILESDMVQSKQMKENLAKEYYRRIRKILKSGLTGKNIIQAINSRAVSLIRYGAGIIDWTQEELRKMDGKTRKLLTIYRSMHEKDDVDRLYMGRKDGGRGLMSIKTVVELEVNNLGYYVRQSGEKLLREVLRERVDFLLSDEPEKIKKTLANERKNKFLDKKLHPVFYKTVTKIKSFDPNSWKWIRKGYLKKETEGTIFALQNQATRTRWTEKNIYNEDVSPKCRMCDERDETIAHVVSECKVFAQNEYKKLRHDKVAAILHWELCKKYGFALSGKSYEHFVDKERKVLENDRAKLLWDWSVQTDVKLDHNKPDLILLVKETKTCYIIDVACPFDTRIDKKEDEKNKHYNDLKYEIKKCWSRDVKKVITVPIIIGALGCVTKNLERNLEQIGASLDLEVYQKTCLLGTARIVRKFLN